MMNCCQNPQPNWFNDSAGGYVLTCNNCGIGYTANNQVQLSLDPAAIKAVDDAADRVVASRTGVVVAPITGATVNNDNLYQNAWTQFEEMAQTKASWGKKTIKTAMDGIMDNLNKDADDLPF